jgi:hypothetical protein
MHDRTGRAHKSGGGFGHWEPQHFIGLFLAALGLIVLIGWVL